MKQQEIQDITSRTDGERLADGQNTSLTPIQLRGHHIFCLLGYRGMGYSAAYTKNMTMIHQTLRQSPETLIEIIQGPDQLCAKFPKDQDYHCQDQNIYERDAHILTKLGLPIGLTIQWKDIEQRIRTNVVPDDIAHVCETCSWRTYDYCQQGVQRMLDAEGLWIVK